MTMNGHRQPIRIIISNKAKQSRKKNSKARKPVQKSTLLLKIKSNLNWPLNWESLKFRIRITDHILPVSLKIQCSQSVQTKFKASNLQVIL